MGRLDDWQVKPGKKVRLADLDPAADLGLTKPEAEEEVSKRTRKLAELHELLWAENARSLLVILQGMDTSGKDGTIKHVMSGVNPQGCQVVSFKQPSSAEADHDFLWRIHAAVPAKGDIGIFNRSHYEDVLVTRVHGLVPEKVWKARYDQINAFERVLTDNHVVILKLFLFISKEEQRERLQARLDDPTKNWKFSAADLEERKRWDDYVAAYEDALSRCSTDCAPWWIVPADRKWVRNWMVSKLIVDTLEGMKMKWPPPRMDLKGVKVQ
jgi:PPK2 family polyphosphate:nucleotide phosphotransferase